MTENRENPTYIPAIEFRNQGLMVSFDHSLQAKPAELLDPNRFFRRDLVQTCFFIRPEDDSLYVGLHFISRGVLREVARGLKTYQEGEAFDQEQQSLLNKSIHLLERLVNPIEED